MTRFSKRFGKTAFVLTTAAILISVLLIFAAFVPSFSVVAEGADGEGSEPAAEVLEISDNNFSGGYVDMKASDVTIGLNETVESGIVTQASGNRVTAQAFSYKTDESGSPLSYYTANINLGGRLQEAIAGGRLRAHIYFTGTITLNASSAGSVRENEPEVNVDLGFELSGGIDGEDAAEGILDASPDFVWDETQSLYTYSEVFEYTADNPLNITDGYVRLSGDSVVLQLYPNFSITRDVVSVGTISNEASAVISGNFYFAFDFYEVEVTLSTDNVQYGKLVAGDHGDLFTRYAEAVMSASSVGSEEIDSLGAELAALPSLTGNDNSAVISYGLTDDIVFTAIPLRGFYFNRWQQGITDTSKVINRGAASRIALNVGIVYSADFNSFSPTNIPVTGQGSGWVYDGSQHGPSLNVGALPGFTVVERYVGSTNKGEPYNTALQPTEAGAYEHRSTLKKDAEYFGVSRVEYTIFRKPAEITLNTDSAAIMWGDCLNDAGISPSSGTVAGVFDIVVGSADEGYETVSAELASTVPAPGEYEFAYRFTPGGDDSANYSENYVTFTVTVDHGFEVGGDGGFYSETPAESAVSGGTFNYTFDVVSSGEGDAVSETLVFTLKAYLTGGAEWSFAGWRANNFYRQSVVSEESGFATYTYDYEIPLDGTEDDKLSSSFRAVYIKTDNSGVASIEFSGNSAAMLSVTNLARNNLFAGDQDLAGYGGISAEIKGYDYDGEAFSDTEPLGIGDHNILVELYTEATVEGSRMTLVETTIAFSIVRRNVSVVRSASASVGYNTLTGWARSVSYTVDNLPNNGVDGYYYVYTLITDGSTVAENEEVVWTKASSFVTPTVYGEYDISAKSAVITYRIIAVSETYGVPTEDTSLPVVAVSDPFTAKLDNTPLTINLFEAVETPEGWMQGLDFTAEVTFGGSGYDLTYGLGSGSSLTGNNVLLGADEVSVTDGWDQTGFTYGADPGTVTTSRTYSVSFRLDTDFIGVPSLGLRNGLSLGAVYAAVADSGVKVTIDASAPQISVETVYGGDPGEGGWYKDAVTVTLTVTDKGGSMPADAAIVAANEYYGITMVKDKSYAGIRYIATVTSSEYFEYTVTDDAGNIGTVAFNFNLQEMNEGDLELISYSAGGGEIWVSDDLSLEFTARLSESASGKLYVPVKLQYRTVSYGDFSDAGGYVTPDPDTGEVTLTFNVSLEGSGTTRYYFRAVAANGVTTVLFDAGTVRNDNVAPTISLNEADYAGHTGEAPWTAEAVRVTVTVTDNLSGIPWDEENRIYGVYVEGRDDVVIEKISDTQFIVNVTDCNEYVISATDRAGNVVSAEGITLNVDPTMSPTFEVVAELTEDTTVTEYESGAWIIGNGTLNVTFTYDVVVSGTTIEYLNAGYWATLVSTTVPEDGSLLEEGHTFTFEIPAVEGKTNYRFRLRTGAGVTVTYPSDGYFTVSRDWTLPGAPSGNYYDSDNNAVDVTGTWSNQPVRWQFALTDSVSGIDAQSISLYDFDPVLMDTPEGEEELQKQLEEAVAAGIGTAPETLANGLYQYVLSESRIYIVRYADVAGNFNMYLFEALIDTTSGFTVNAVPYLKTGDQTASDPLDSGTVLSDDQSVLFRFEVTDAEGGTFVAGASGLRAEYSFNGTDWLFVDEGFVVGVPELEFGSQAIGNIRIRLVTGAGIAVECSFDGESSFAYNKDTVEISLSLSASVTDEDGFESGYVSGEWTCNTVRVTVEIVAGAYGGTLSATGFDEVRIPENSGTAYHTYEISENTDSTFTFRFVSDKDGGSVEEVMEIRIDKREVTLELTGEYDPDGQGGYRFEVGEEGWAFGEVVITAEVSAGFSGVAGVEYSYIDGEWHTAELTDGVYRIVWADADNATDDGRTYSVRAASVSGMAAESEIIILIDEENPQNGELTLTGSKGAGSDWYYTDVGISRRGLPTNYSGTYFEYSAVLIDGGTERTDPVTGRCALDADATDADFITLTDEPFSAGYGEWKITYWWVTGAGRMTNGGEIVIGIDKNEYSFTAYSSVGGVTDELITEENRFAVMKDNGLLSGKLYRGMPLNNINFRASAEGGGIQNGFAFLLRNVTVNGEVRVEYNYTDPAASMTYNLHDVYVEGDTVVEVGLYCAVVPEFVNLEQSVQANGRFVPITLNFPLILNGWFRYALQYTVTMPDEFDVGDPYGQYICTANMTGEFADNFPLVSYTDGEYVQSNTAAVTVRYFENAGTDEDMFRVRGIDDFKMIDRYTNPSDPGQIAFGYDGDHKYFLQEADIVLDSSFGGLKNVFNGVYNGGGYAFIADRVGGNTFRGVFSSVKGGRIEELKVEILRYEISSDGDYAVLTPYIGGAGAGVSNVFVSANVYIQNAAVYFGGVAAKADGALIAMSFAAVNVFADSVSGYVGGIVGSLTGGSYLTRCLSVSTITADGCNAPGGVGGAALFAGSLAGYADGAGSTHEANFYMDGGVSYGEASLSERGLGNNDYADAEKLKFTAVEGQVGVSASETEILGMAPSELVNYYTGRLAERLEVSGTGSENNPFAISDAYALELVALVPWAYFRQTADIAPGSYAEYMNATPFRGNYNGDGFALTDIDLSDSGSSLGLFRSFEGTLTNLYIADMYADFLLPDGGYAGAFAGIIADNAAVSGVVITGNITVDAGGTVYAGGFAGISRGEADNIVSAIGMRLIASYAFIGGFAGNISGGKVEYVALAGGYEADYTGRADVGTVAGELNSDGADAIVMQAIGYIAGASAAAGYSVTIPFVGESDYVPVAESRSGLSGSKAYTSGKYAVTVGERLNGVYPFASGSGTDLDPFVINGYREFRNITSYMDASFVIGADFVLGDLNGDGIAEEKFEGFGGTFSGSISGNSRIISGLTTPLFEELSGSVRNLTFDAEIRSYSGSVIFGAVAERALPGALISRITVTGSAEIYADASSEIIFGGVSGISDGASVIGASMNMNVKLRGGTIFYGGIIGDSTAPQSEHSATWHIQSSVSADIGGVSVSAGKYIGIMRGDSTAVFASSASSLKINNVSDSRNVGKTLNS